MVLLKLLISPWLPFKNIENRRKMFLEFPCTISIAILYYQVNVNGKCSWNPLSKLLYTPSLNPHRNFMENAPGAPWAIPSCLFMESLLEVNGNVSGPWADSCIFLHGIRMKSHWEMFLELAVK